MLALGVDGLGGSLGTDFRPSRNGDDSASDETEPVTARSLRECREAMVRRRRLNAYLGFPVAPIVH